MLLAGAARAGIVAANLRGRADELLDRMVVVMIMVAIGAMHMRRVVGVIVGGGLDGVGHGWPLKVRAGFLTGHVAIPGLLAKRPVHCARP